MTTPTSNPQANLQGVDSRYAWIRLLVSLALMTVGSAGMYSVTVVLPRIQAEFGVARADASLPYTLTMIGFGVGGVLLGRVSDRFGVMVPMFIGTIGLGLGFTAAGASSSLWQFSLAQGVLMGLLGTAATFAPLVADTSRWFDRYRGIALAICMSGNYLAGAIWPPVVQHFIESVGWRQTYSGLGLFCVVTMLPLAGPEMVKARTVPVAECAKSRVPAAVSVTLDTNGSTGESEPCHEPRTLPSQAESATMPAE